MKLRILSASVVLGALAVTLTAQAGDPGCDIVHSMARDFKRRNCWPKPFVYPDRQAVREPLAIMVANGWQRQNLVGDYHFDAGTGQLTEAGRMKVLWVLSEAPEQHRSIYVHRAATPEETAARMTAVQELVAQNSAGQPPPPVLETNKSIDPWPADLVDAINKKFQTAIPDPKLPAPQSTTFGGGGGGGG
jgi:hypothetical protein